MSDDYFFHRAAERQLSRFNKRNVATVLGEVVKFHNGLKNKSIYLWVFWKKSQKFIKICSEEPVLGSFYCKVAVFNSL